jgi:hypothetical protein
MICWHIIYASPMHWPVRQLKLEIGIGEAIAMVDAVNDSNA